MTTDLDSPRIAPSHPFGTELAPVLATSADDLEPFPFPSQKRSCTHIQHWAGKTGRSITNSEAPHCHAPNDNDNDNDPGGGGSLNLFSYQRPDPL